MSPGKSNMEFETTKPITLLDNLGQLGVVPVGARLFSDGYVAPDVGFMGCLPIEFGDSLKINQFMKPVGALRTSFSRGGENEHVFIVAKADLISK